MKPKEQNYAVEMLNITKIYSSTIFANKDVNLKVRTGTIHAVIGENGAGKSTLMSILFGLVHLTRGQIKIFGKEVYISDPLQAHKYGIAMVHQHFELVQNFTTLQNIILGNEISKASRMIDYETSRKKIIEIMKRYNLKIDLDAKIENISIGMQQRTEILKVLYLGAEIIIFDEPTAVLTPQETEDFFKIMAELKRAGKTIIFIGHKVSEIKKNADEVTVIRDGKSIDNFLIDMKSEKEIAKLVIGRDLEPIKNLVNVKLGPVKINIQNISIKKNAKFSFFNKYRKNHKALKQNLNNIYALNNFSLQVHAGEIVGIAGIEGNGQEELIKALTGLLPVETGTVTFNSKNVTNKSTKILYRSGMSHIPSNRHKYAIISEFSVNKNIVLPDIEHFPFSKFGFMKRFNINHYAQNVITAFNVKGSRHGFAKIKNLSGGNQQKVVVGRELTRKHDILIVAQPTRGLDVGAIETIHKELLQEKQKGKAILLISYDLNEVISLADRIVVMHEGKKIGEVLQKNAQIEEIGLMMLGKKIKKMENS